jgi:hypothetical protein
MAKQVINVGTAANDGTGDTIRSAFQKTKGNFDELYTGLDEKVAKGNIIGSGLTQTGAGFIGRDSGGGALTLLDASTAKTFLTLTKGDVGLGNVDNTSDANKPVSTAQASAIAAKENSITAGTTGQYWRGDKSWQTLDKSAVGLANVSNTSDASKPVSTAQQTALDGKANTIHTHVAADISLAAGQVLLGKNTTGAGAALELTTTQVKTLLALNNVDNTSDADKPVSDATQTALNGKAATNHTHTISQVTGLQTELDGKSATTHNHDITTLTGYAAAMATKADASHTHAISDVTGLAAQLVHSIRAFEATPEANSRVVDVVDTSFTVVVANSIAVAGVAATASTVFNIRKNDVTIGTVTFAASSVTGTIVIGNAGDRNFVLGDVVEFVAPGSPDATLARIAFVLRN